MQSPRWREIADDLSFEISTGKYGPGDQLPSAAALAEATSVSRLTANRALEELQRQGAVVRDGRRGTVVAPRAKRRTGRIALIVDQIDHIQNFPRPELLAGIHDGLGDEFNLLLCDAKADPKREIDLLNQMADECDGILCWSTDGSRAGEAMNRLRAKGIPLVLLDRIPDGALADAVVPDSVNATREALEYLIAEGHTRIALFTFDKPDVSTVVERCSTYEAIMAEHGLETNGLVRKFAPSLEVSDRAYFDQAVSDALFAMARSENPVTAVLCIQDLIGYAVLAGAENLGLEIPNQLEVVTFNDWPPIWLRRPWQAHRITILPEQMGSKAIELLRAQIDGQSTEHGTYRIPAKFVAVDGLFSSDSIRTQS
ncbi:MAG: GntR family transcriptional regulator [Armatimonadetes bacterium]|nr:GntR family transcriptional regulator [Armatimonadota bacterium]